jgi:hypothetical protein
MCTFSRVSSWNLRLRVGILVAMSMLSLPEAADALPRAVLAARSQATIAITLDQIAAKVRANCADCAGSTVGAVREAVQALEEIRGEAGVDEPRRLALMFEACRGVAWGLAVWASDDQRWALRCLRHAYADLTKLRPTDEDLALEFSRNVSPGESAVVLRDALARMPSAPALRCELAATLIATGEVRQGLAELEAAVDLERPLPADCIERAVPSLRAAGLNESLERLRARAGRSR